MRNIILIILLTLPFFMVAQTKVKRPSNDLRSAEKTTYVTMEVIKKSTSVAVKSPKNKKEVVNKSKDAKSSYVFNSADKKLSMELNKLSNTFKSEIMALNYLFKIGWELVDVDQGKYYFKSKRTR
ncbi:MAG: hypothetical protein QNK67_03605 [Flavobacteriales bacterium]